MIPPSKMQDAGRRDIVEAWGTPAAPNQTADGWAPGTHQPRNSQTPKCRHRRADEGTPQADRAGSGFTSGHRESPAGARAAAAQRVSGGLLAARGSGRRWLSSGISGIKAERRPGRGVRGRVPAWRRFVAAPPRLRGGAPGRWWTGAQWATVASPPSSPRPRGEVFAPTHG